MDRSVSEISVSILILVQGKTWLCAHLCFNKMAYPHFGHHGDGDGITDLFYHLRVALEAVGLEYSIDGPRSNILLPFGTHPLLRGCRLAHAPAPLPHMHRPLRRCAPWTEGGFMPKIFYSVTRWKRTCSTFTTSIMTPPYRARQLDLTRYLIPSMVRTFNI